jgi:hypothetical protein
MQSDSGRRLPISVSAAWNATVVWSRKFVYDEINQESSQEENIIYTNEMVLVL